MSALGYQGSDRYNWVEGSETEHCEPWHCDE